VNGLTDITKLDSCGCCESVPETPAVENPPGRPALAYRIGTHSAFLRRMTARLSRQRLPDGKNAGRRPLADLSTRSGGDPAVALLDAWSVVGDVLTFYQERLANEGYLRTATERPSVLELARAIGYELRPGVAAETYLAFLLDEAETSPQETAIPAGTKVQSIPIREGELPQTFETSLDFEAKVWWNALRPALTKPQNLTLDAREVILKGAGLNIAPGDRMLLVESDAAGGVSEIRRKLVRAVERDPDQDRTVVRFETAPGEVMKVKALAKGGAAHKAGTAPVPSGLKKPFNEAHLDGVLGADLTEAQFQAYMGMAGWKVMDVLEYAKRRAAAAAAGAVKVLVFRDKAGIFGHNAPHFKTLSTEAQGAFHNWDDPDWDVWKDSVNTSGSAGYYADADVYLDRPVSGIVAESWALLERPGGHRVYRVKEAVEGSLAGFGISARVLGLELRDPDGSSPYRDGAFTVRRTTAFVRSEELEPAPVQITEDIEEGATELTLEGLAPGLSRGRPAAVTGGQADAGGVLRSEIKVLDAISHSNGRTTLKFSQGLQHSYTRDTVVVNANVVKATHGETVAGEVLGSGDGARRHQRFTLKRPPLTYVSAATASGTETTLSLRVNGVEWKEVQSLHGLDGGARRYIARIDDDGRTSVVFGDGKSGARLPTGRENVVATYRSGIGSEGEVAAGSLTLLKTRPFGVRRVTNPVDASGADDPEDLDGARENAPLTVLTLDRIVSLRDFEDFARAFTGIGKAQAVALWNGETELVHITVADAGGDEVRAGSDLFRNLRDAVNMARDPRRAVEIGSFQPRYFELDARVLMDPAYEWEDVKSQIESALAGGFSFAKRAFGQSVTQAEVVSVIHGVQGVVAVDTEKLYVLGETGLPAGDPLSSVLPARTARPNTAPTPERPGRFLPAELLLINEFGIRLTEMESS